MNDIVIGISQKLYETFGEDYTIYSENVDQNFQEPCFFIKHISGSLDELVGDRWFETNSFVIHYFPKIEFNNEEINDVIPKLYDCLEYITVNDGLLKGVRRNYKIVEGVLEFFIEYNYTLVKRKIPDMMIGMISTTTEVKYNGS